MENTPHCTISTQSCLSFLNPKHPCNYFNAKILVRRLVYLPQNKPDLQFNVEKMFIKHTFHMIISCVWFI